MKTVLNSLVTVLLLVVGCHSQRESSFQSNYDFSRVNKVAIVSVEGAVQSELAKDEIADFFAIELLEQGYAPMGRAQVRATLAEQQAEDEMINLSTPEGAVEAGILLNVPVVMTIRIPHFGDEISITATMVDVDSSSILWLATCKGKDGGGLFSFFDKKSDAGQQESLLGPIVGDVMGSMDQPLAPEQAERAQRVVKKLCRSLPPKVSTAPEW